MNISPFQESAEQELIRASNEMHLMYLHATEKVLKDDKLLRLFDIPEVLWPRISFVMANRRHQMITGRLDFVWMSEESKL